MEKRTREIIALVVFALLLVCAGLACSVYFSTGKTWTVAATMVDDGMGRMDGYAAIVYPGIKEKAETSDDGSDSKTESSESLDVQSLDVDGDEDSGQDVVTDSIGLRVLSILPDVLADGYDGVFVSDVNELYAKKDADVISADFSDLEAYSTPVIYNAAQKKIGIFSIDYYATQGILSDIVDEIKEAGADIVVCVAKRQQMLATLDGIDVLVATAQDDLSAEGVQVGNTLVVSAPEVGQVGVLVFSSSNVASARVIDSL
jgi:hypothetical protein